MAIKHSVTKSTGQAGYSTEWNADHVIDSDIPFNGHSGTGVGEPINPSDIATKNYVDNKGGGNPFKVKTISDATMRSVFCSSSNTWTQIANLGTISASSVYSLIQGIALNIDTAYGAPSPGTGGGTTFSIRVRIVANTDGSIFVKSFLQLPQAWTSFYITGTGDISTAASGLNSATFANNDTSYSVYIDVIFGTSGKTAWIRNILLKIYYLDMGIST